jgi:hypothetical protein
VEVDANSAGFEFRRKHSLPFGSNSPAASGALLTLVGGEGTLNETDVSRPDRPRIVLNARLTEPKVLDVSVKLPDGKADFAIRTALVDAGVSVLDETDLSRTDRREVGAVPESIVWEMPGEWLPGLAAFLTIILFIFVKRF